MQTLETDIDQEMKKYIIITAISLISTATFGQSNDLFNTIREELFYTEFDLEKCVAFHEKLTLLERANPTIIAYEAAAKALIAKHSWNPFTKIGSLKEALQLLDDAIQSDQVNPEIRFIRLYIENNTPNYLGMNKNMTTDKEVILKSLKDITLLGLNPSIISYIKDYMSNSAICTTEELHDLKATVL